MKVYSRLEEFKPLANAIVTTGTFDGVHIGHRSIIHRLKTIAKQSKGETVIISFYPHPRLVLFPEDNQLRLINTLEEKIQLLEACGVNHLLLIPFTLEFSRLSSEQFIRDILINTVGTKKLVIGYDHHFGRNREGSFAHLKQFGPEYGFDVEEIPAQDIDEVAVSSTKIRQALENGDITTANNYLQTPFIISGTVVKGDQIGRALGFPTANLSIPDPNKLIPREGIYGVKAQVKGKTHKGMLYIGKRPVLGTMSLSIEVFLFDFSEDIYGEYIEVSLLHYLREDRHFPSLDALKVQMQEDEQKARKILG